MTREPTADQIARWKADATGVTQAECDALKALIGDRVTVGVYYARCSRCDSYLGGASGDWGAAYTCGRCSWTIQLTPDAHRLLRRFQRAVDAAFKLNLHDIPWSRDHA